MCINKQSKLKVVKKNISLSFEARRHFPHIDALIKKKMVRVYVQITPLGGSNFPR